jgi:hypothetical protein
MTWKSKMILTHRAAALSPWQVKSSVTVRKTYKVGHGKVLALQNRQVIFPSHIAGDSPWYTILSMVYENDPWRNNSYSLIYAEIGSVSGHAPTFSVDNKNYRIKSSLPVWNSSRAILPPPHRKSFLCPPPPSTTSPTFPRKLFPVPPPKSFDASYASGVTTEGIWVNLLTRCLWQNQMDLSPYN